MSENQTENKELIESVLKKEQGDITFEAIPDENDSPLAQPVIDKNETSPGPPVKNEAGKTSSEAQNNPGEESGAQEHSKGHPKPSDAPEQEIDAIPSQEDSGGPGEGSGQTFSIPLEHARLMADTILGVANNVLEVGGGYFITVKKHKDFYDFDEVIQIIDNQNVKNIKRLKLDEEDKALLRPLLVQVLRKQSKVMSVEQQLLGVALSIIIKKARVVMEIRAENEIMVERIRDVIRKEVAAGQNYGSTGSQDETEEEEEEEEEEHEQERNQSEMEYTQTEEIARGPQMNYTQNGIPASVLETNSETHI